MAKPDRNGVGICEPEAGRAIVRWCLPVLFSLLETHDVVRLLGALLAECKVLRSMLLFTVHAGSCGLLLLPVDHLSLSPRFHSWCHNRSSL
jgi:hypothetical protein